VSDELVTSDRLDDLVARCVELIEQHGEEALADFCRDSPADAEAVRGRIELLRSAGLLGGGEAVPERLGEFRLVRRLGSGGMGVVYLAVQEPLGRLVALKLVRPNQLYFPGTRERFRREVEAAARLQHESIVAVYTVGEAFGIPYYAMEYVPGCTLAMALRELLGSPLGRLRGADLAAVVARHAPAQDGALAEWPDEWVETCLHIAVQLADALAHAHLRGVVHRDVKPSNVLLTPRGAARLADFGLAKLDDASGLSRTCQRLGTPFYMSPEQVAGGKGGVDARADVYSLGVVLYELLTLRVPFPGDSEEDVYRAILTRTFPSPRRLNHEVDRDLEAVVLKCLEHDAADRYADSAALASDLRRRQRGEPTLARPVAPVIRRLRSVRRWSTPALLLLAGAVVPAWLLADAWLRGRAPHAEWLHLLRLGTLLPPLLLLGWLATQMLRKRLARRPARLLGFVTALLPCLLVAGLILEQRADQVHARERVALEGVFRLSSREALRQLEAFEQRWGDEPTDEDLALGARILLDNGRPARAVERARQLAARAPARPAVHALLRSVGEALGDEATVAQEDAWLAAHPVERLGWSDLLDLGNVLAGAGHVDQAIEAFRAAGQQAGVDRDNLDRLMADALMRECRWDDAVAYLDPVLLWQPHVVVNARLAVRLAVGRSDWAVAEVYLGRLVDAPYDTQFDERFRFLMARGDTTAAFALLDSVASQHADDPVLVDRVAREAFRNGRIELARTLYERLLALAERRPHESPAAVHAHIGLAAVLVQMDQLEDAERHALAAVAIDPSYYEAHQNLAEARLRLALRAAGNSPDALPVEAWRDYAAELRAALACHALQPQALNNLAFALGRLHRADPGLASLDEARKLARHALDLLTDPPGSRCSEVDVSRRLRSSTWDTLAGLHEQAGDGDGALVAAREALAAAPPGDPARASRSANVERLDALLSSAPEAASGR
jgi:serine/threonine protein kinase/tetratricopeptide (TPR) repeat protein